MWRRVSVFAGSFDLDAAEAVCAGGVTTEPVVDLVHGLMAKSILSRGTGHGQARYRLLDTIGEFGLCKLRAEGDERELRGRHRDWYAGLAAQQEAFGYRRTEWLDRLDADHENLRGAIEFCLSEPREVAAGAQMACDLWRYWETHGHLTEGRRILAAVLAKLDETAPIRPRALWVAGYLAELQGDILDARARLEAGISAARDSGDIRAIAYASTYLGPVLYSLREPARGHAVTEIALRLHRKNADQFGVALTATVVLSFAAALGVSAFFFNHVFGFGGADTSFPLFVFVFLVAPGHRLQHPPDDPGPGGGNPARRPARRDHRARRDRGGDHLGRLRAGRHVRRPRHDPVHTTDRNWFRRCVRHPARHDHRAVRAGYRAQPGPRSVDVVAQQAGPQTGPGPGRARPRARHSLDCGLTWVRREIARMPVKGGRISCDCRQPGAPVCGNTVRSRPR
jgi:hypothetical protein